MAGGRAGVNNPGANAIDHCVTAITPIETAVQPYYCIERELWHLKGRVMTTVSAAAGAVIAWFPPSSALRRGVDGSVTIRPPSGWTICDGTKGTPDLSDRFIIDCLRNEKTGSSGREATHRENVQLDPSESTATFVTLIHIMKL
jgi:hypothetical protein